ncbi:hypothetical protein JMJ55_06415 [Belnapia sp. T6]|uniref:Lipoprotein n=1 Tax=Belnapia mucosa TaxID=2804532 RepID=A0ABS1UZS2_9PROT|nr:hypothetical protein [Belnapia mucosa]MBL6454949.1 hypothetical protein [Belnapia mucosa]
MHILRASGLLAATLTLSACMVRVPVSEQPPPRYATASPYAASAPGAYRPADPYCAEAEAVAADQAMRADVTGRGRDARRAERTEQYARRDCR